MICHFFKKCYVIFFSTSVEWSARELSQRRKPDLTFYSKRNSSLSRGIWLY